VYYAGHGIQVQGKNHLIPVDVGLNREGDLRRTVLLDDLLTEVNQARELGLVILDACRDNPFAARLNQGAGRSVAVRGLARVEQTGKNTLVAFATREDTIAADTGVYAAALVQHLATPGLELRQLFGKVRDEVMARTGNGQQPYIYGSLGGGYYTFKPGPSPPPDGNRDPEVVFWDSVKDSRNPAVFRIYLERYPNGTFAKLAQIRLAELERPVSPSPAPRTLTGQEVFNKVCMACHAAGAAGAPKVGAEDQWEPRFAQGLDTLVKNAVNGIRNMPAKGGNPTLSETNIKDAIVYMLGETGIKTDLAPKVNNRLNDKGHQQSLSPLRKKWSTKLETFEKSGHASFNKPTILGNRIYGGIMKRVFALDTRTGNILWTRELSWYVHQNSSLDVTNGHVWVATGSEAYKLDMDTGAVIWKTNLPGNGVVNMTSYIDGKVVVLGNGGLYALDQGGQIAWHNRNMAGDGFATYKGVIYVGNKQEGQQTHMVGLDINTGEVLRKFATTHWARWEPTVHLGVLYFVDVGENLYALDIDNWTLQWKIKLEGRTYSPPIIKKGMLYIATDHTYAIDISTGSIRWLQPYGEGTAAPFVGVDGLYVIGMEYTIDRNLSDLIGFQEPEYLTSKFNADDLAKLQSHLEKHGYRGKVLEDGYGILTFIYRLDINTGEVLWKERISNLTDSDCTPTEVDGTIYVGSNDGMFHALDFN
jgi:outer membrane protein assembly factor BamB/cytochrome c5